MAETLLDRGAPQLSWFNRLRPCNVADKLQSFRVQHSGLALSPSRLKRLVVFCPYARYAQVLSEGNSNLEDYRCSSPDTSLYKQRHETPTISGKVNFRCDVLQNKSSESDIPGLALLALLRFGVQGFTPGLPSPRKLLNPDFKTLNSNKTLNSKPYNP